MSSPVAQETIAAISTAVGEGAISLIRLSGETALTVADQTFRGKEKPSELPSHTQRLGEIHDGDTVVDQVMIAVHRAPASYTGEDVVEISCHGGVHVTARVLQACLAAGARAARPGEFTERAFLNGKMDLTQAEAVIDVIRARTDLALRAANQQLEGRLGEQVRAVREKLIELIANVEASIDFPDEDIAPEEGSALQQRLESCRAAIAALIGTADRGRILREGIRVVISGPTNAGKSSLLNRMLGHDRAIVSEIHGTTRDTIEEQISMRGIPVRLLDTAGLRESADPLERAGISRTERSLEAADIILHVFDRNAAKPSDFVARAGDERSIILLNKNDLPEHADWAGVDALRISCVADDGLRGLEDQILARVSRDHVVAESAAAINARHRDCLQRALDACDRARATMQQELAPEYVAVDLRAALRAVGEVTGADDIEEILDSVFAQFCIGK